MGNIHSERSLLCFYGIWRITAFHFFFTVQVITVLRPPSNLLSTSYLQNYWLQLWTVSGIKLQLSFTTIIQMWRQMSSRAPAWRLSIAMKEKKESDLQDKTASDTPAEKCCGTVDSAFSVLFVIAAKSMSLWGTLPGLLQLMTAGGCPTAFAQILISDNAKGGWWHMLEIGAQTQHVLSWSRHGFAYRLTVCSAHAAIDLWKARRGSHARWNSCVPPRQVMPMRLLRQYLILVKFCVCFITTVL